MFQIISVLYSKRTTCWSSFSACFISRVLTAIRGGAATLHLQCVHARVLVYTFPTTIPKPRHDFKRFVIIFPFSESWSFCINSKSVSSTKSVSGTKAGTISGPGLSTVATVRPAARLPRCGRPPREPSRPCYDLTRSQLIAPTTDDIVHTSTDVHKIQSAWQQLYNLTKHKQSFYTLDDTLKYCEAALPYIYGAFVHN